MNTEPVKTTLRGAATFVTATAAVAQAALLFISQVMMWLAPSSTGIPVEIQQSFVALLTVALTWWTMIRASDKLREQVTPWDPEVGARTPGPTEYTVDPVDPPAG